MNKHFPALALTGLAALVVSAHAQTSGNKTTTPTITPPPSINALSAQASAELIESCNNKMQSLLAALDKGDYTGAEMDFDDTMKAGLTRDQLQQAWQSLPAKFGQPLSRGAAHNSTSDNYIVITVPMQYQSGNLAAQIACGANGKIAGFHVMTIPAAVPASTAGG